jgi:hypothetical protein
MILKAGVNDGLKNAVLKKRMAAHRTAIVYEK